MPRLPGQPKKSRTKKPDDGLCDFRYDMRVRITQAEAQGIAAGDGLTAEVGAKLKAAIDDDVLMSSAVFKAWWNDPPAPADVKRISNQSQDIDDVQFKAAGRLWTIPASLHRDLIKMSARIQVRRL